MLYYKADIGVIGGSGLYELCEDVKQIEVDTPYGKPSDVISLATVGDKKVAFLPRHGKGHTLNPSEINYRANIDAMAQLGVKALISPCCVGSLNPKMGPGDFVVTDQFINMTSGRKDTFNESPNVVHLSSADPYDNRLRRLAVEEAEKLGITVHDGGTVVIINGPRFSTRAESKMFAMMGGDMPIALGVIRDVEAPTYDVAVHQQIEEVQAKIPTRDLRELLMQGEVWEVK